MPYIVSIFMATVITEGTVDVGFPAVLDTELWELGCRHWIMAMGFGYLHLGMV